MSLHGPGFGSLWDTGLFAVCWTSLSCGVIIIVIIITTIIISIMQRGEVQYTEAKMPEPATHEYRYIPPRTALTKCSHTHTHTGGLAD